jgi:phosphohistidine swiveling domain-containing protein
MAIRDRASGERQELLWVVDDVPSRRFPIYTRGNTGEVYPNVITPLCGSVVKGPIAAGQEQVFLELGGAVPGDLTEQDCAVLTGCFGGYLYGNLSIGRLLGTRAPGMKPEDVDTQMWGTNDAPPYTRQRGDRNVRASLRLTRFMVRTLRGPDFGWLHAERAAVRAWAASRPAPASASNAELLATVEEGGAWFAPLMRSLVLASAYGGAAAAVLERLAAKADVEVRARTSVGVGDVDSAGPAGALWGLAQIVNATPALAAAFDGGPPITPRVAALGEEAAPFRSALDAFLADYGARGPDEWELASHTWGTDPDIALAAVERIRHSHVADPAAVHARLTQERHDAIEVAAAVVSRPVRRMFRRCAQTVATGAAGRERAKGTIIEAAYATRLALFELVRRAQDNGAPDDRLDCWLVTVDELPAFVDRPGDFADVIAERRVRRDYLQARIPPFVFEGTVPDPATWELRAEPRSGGAAVPAAGSGAQLTGIPVSPGVARGPARVVRDPSDPAVLQPGDVLVAPITDPAWTPLFLVASAVVVEVGANLSHAAIVARELGIPAVVSVDHATDRLADGTVVEVDGTHGTVTVTGP